MVGQLSGHYASNQNSSQYSEGSSDASQYVNKSASIAMGPHWTFNPKSKVSFGTFLMLGAGYATSSRSPETKTSSSSLSGTQAQALNGSQSSIGGIANVSPINYDTQQVTGYSVSGVAGITVDAELTKNLSLRIAANVLRANYQVLKTEYKSSNSAATQSHEESGFRADFGFEPSIALRLTF